MYTEAFSSLKYTLYVYAKYLLVCSRDTDLVILVKGDIISTPLQPVVR